MKVSTESDLDLIRSPSVAYVRYMLRQSKTSSAVISVCWSATPKMRPKAFPTRVQIFSRCVVCYFVCCLIVRKADSNKEWWNETFSSNGGSLHCWYTKWGKLPSAFGTQTIYHCPAHLFTSWGMATLLHTTQMSWCTELEIIHHFSLSDIHDIEKCFKQKL